MDLARLAVTALGLGLIVAVNLFFFVRRGAGRLPREPGGAGVKTGPKPADEAPAGR
jgi:hypothetical protein